MNVGWIGLGKLGFSIADEIAKTHDVLGYDVAERWPERVRMQDTLRPLLDCDLIFVAVQTPHGPEYEGVTRLPDTRADFDYSYLTQAVRDFAAAGEKRPPLVIVSTVLPGTIEREVLPLWDGPVIYNPFFIAMGTEVADFLDPEFVLMGADPSTLGTRTVAPGRSELREFYTSLGIGPPGCPIFCVGYREAELAKMAYNTFIGLKIAYANTIGEMSHRLGINADNVVQVVKAGTRRILSDRYLDPGMGDGGPCHPRDNIALSWIARETGMSYDLFGAVMEQREAHADWQAGLVQEAACDAESGWQKVPVTLLGKSYKPGTSIETGSAAKLVAALLAERGILLRHVEDLR